MNDLIRELVLFLSRDALTVEDIADRVGPVARDPGVPMPLELRPVLAGVRSARLSRYPESGLPYVLTIEPAPVARPTAATLKAAFGDYRRSLTDLGRPIEVIFYPPAAGAHWKVAVIAELLPRGDSLDDASVTTLALRRDPISSRST